MAKPKPKLKAKKSATKPLTAPKAATKRSAKIEAGPVQPFPPRARIAHRSFGTGTVLAVDGDKLEIRFKSVGVKWIVDSFVSPA